MAVIKSTITKLEEIRNNYKILNPNLYSNGQTFTPLDNGGLLITGGCYDEWAYGSDYERSKYAAIITKKTVISYCST